LLLNPSPETVRKIGLVRKLLKDGKPLYRAIREAKLGWKNYYKYAPLIYDDQTYPFHYRRRPSETIDTRG